MSEAGKQKARELMAQMAEAWERDVQDFEYASNRGIEAQVAFDTPEEPK